MYRNPKLLLKLNTHVKYRYFRKCITYIHDATPETKVLGIRREDFTVWERRAPLSPAHVRTLVRKGYKVLVQPSNRRAYAMQEYAKAGAKVTEDMSEARVILGVKQIPIDLLEPEKTYVFFSHTIKAQEANMPLLDAILEKKIRLIDFEKMVDERGLRVVAFGKYAGVAGMINILHGLGIRLLALGHHTPFMHLGLAHNYRNSDMARQSIRDAGYEISLGMLPKSLGPLTFVFTGSGNVSQGAQEVFQELPHEYVSPEHLESVAKHGSTRKIYACEVSREHHLERKAGGGYDEEEYEQYPERYISTFSRKIAPHTSVLVNGLYWGINSPRILAIPDAKTLLRPSVMPWLPSTVGTPQLPHRLMAICDVSADPGGSIEFMRKTTTIDSPFELYDADENIHTDSFAGAGVLICSIDNMPAQIPREATEFFGSLLLPYIPEIARSDAQTSFNDYDVSPVIKDATIASNGHLTERFKYITELRRKNQQSKQKTSSVAVGDKNVLILGSGYVSAPVVDYLSRQDDMRITVASQIQHEIDSLASRYPNTTSVLLELHRSQSDLEKLIAENDLVISLLPYSLHPHVAEMCIRNETNMVTASYRSREIMALHQKAVDAGITIVNEVGVDPGIDHLLAMEVFDEVAESGGKVTSFISWCGGLPAPESSGNPLGYKFSWSPRGVLLNVLSSARWLENGQVKDVPAGGALLDATQQLSFLPGLNLEGFPNRDSTIYSELYGINSADTILRGTLRYKGFSNAMKGLVHMGLINAEPHPALHPNGPDITWKSLMCDIVGQKKDILTDSLKDLIFEKVGKDEQRLAVFEGLGLLEDELIDKKATPIDTLSNYLSKKLSYGEGERDIIVMRHEMIIDWRDHTRENHNVDFVVYGEPRGYSAMAATVGYPTAIAAKMVLDGEIQEKGAVLPFRRSVYKPMLSRLKQEGLIAKSYSVPIKG